MLLLLIATKETRTQQFFFFCDMYIGVKYKPLHTGIIVRNVQFQKL